MIIGFNRGGRQKSSKIMGVKINKRANNNYDITAKGGTIIHSNKDLNFVIGYLGNQLQSGFKEIRITI